MLIAGFDWDDGNWPKCAKHGVAQNEIEFALTNGPAIFPSGAGEPSEMRFSAIGRNAEGRFIFVIFTFRRFQKEIRLRPISARYMHAKEIARYEQDRAP